MNAVLSLIFWLLMQFGAPNPLCPATIVSGDEVHQSCPVNESAPPPPAEITLIEREGSAFINNGF